MEDVNAILEGHLRSQRNFCLLNCCRVSPVHVAKPRKVPPFGTRRKNTQDWGGEGDGRPSLKLATNHWNSLARDEWSVGFLSLRTVSGDKFWLLPYGFCPWDPTSRHAINFSDTKYPGQPNWLHSQVHLRVQGDRKAIDWLAGASVFLLISKEPERLGVWHELEACVDLT